MCTAEISLAGLGDRARQELTRRQVLSLKEISFQAVTANLEAGSELRQNRQPLMLVTVELPASRLSQVLEEFSISEILDHFDKEDILEAIGDTFISDWLADN